MKETSVLFENYPKSNELSPFCYIQNDKGYFKTGCFFFSFGSKMMINLFIY